MALVGITLLLSICVPMKPSIIAHRGYDGVDNTIQAFKNSTAFAGVEGDVRITADGVFL